MKHSHKNRIVLALDSHQLNDYQMCKQKGWLANVEHLVQLTDRKSFRLGTFIHDMLHRMGRARMNRREFTDTQLLQMCYKRIARCKAFTQDERMFQMQKITQYYAIEKHQPYQIIGNEVGFSKVLYENNDVRFIYQGRIDRIDRVPKERIISWVDYKTQTKDYRIFSNSNQFIGYSWALGTNYGFIQFYGLQKEKEPRECFKRQSLFHSSEIIEQWKHDTITTFHEIASRAPFGAAAFERRRCACSNFDFNTFDINTCEYLKICDNAPYGNDMVERIKRTSYKKVEWHPWSGPLDSKLEVE